GAPEGGGPAPDDRPDRPARGRGTAPRRTEAFGPVVAVKPFTADGRFRGGWGIASFSRTRWATTSTGHANRPFRARGLLGQRRRQGSVSGSASVTAVCCGAGLIASPISAS
ncbi:hypothetical protein PBV88_40720, partial [Streptomyces sp. T21Q-yed]|nr:hypothetical protein [Streptomyces sp. T21Q-yed]